MSIISPFPFLQFSLFITPVNCYCRSNTPSNFVATLQFNSFNYGFFIYIYTFFFLQIFVSTGLGVNVNFLVWRMFQIGLSVACKLFDLYCLFYYDCCLGCTILLFCFSICLQGTRTGHPRTLSKVYFYLTLNLSFCIQKSWHVFWVII